MVRDTEGTSHVLLFNLGGKNRGYLLYKLTYYINKFWMCFDFYITFHHLKTASSFHISIWANMHAF